MPQLLAQPDLPQPATFAEWYVDDGAVEAGQLLYRVECDCLSLDVEADADAVIERLLGPGTPLRPSSPVAELYSPADRGQGIVDLEAARPQPLASLTRYFEDAPAEQAAWPEVARPMTGEAPVAGAAPADIPEEPPLPPSPPSPPALEVVPTIAAPPEPIQAAPVAEIPLGPVPAQTLGTDALAGPPSSAAPHDRFLRSSMPWGPLAEATGMLSEVWGAAAPGVLEFTGYAAAAAIARSEGRLERSATVALRDRGRLAACKRYIDRDSFRTFLESDVAAGALLDCVVSSLEGTGVIESYPVLVSGCSLALTIGAPDAATATVAISLAYEPTTISELAAFGFLQTIRDLLERPYVLLAG